MQQSNEAQFEAIHHVEGPMMVLAGPGAGKTFVITNRVAHLITEAKVPPEEILVVTFSRAAANEMKERFDILTDHRCRGVRFGTFHSVFFEILKKAYHYEAKDIVTEGLKFRLIAEALNDTGFEVEDKQEFLESIEKEISRVKGDGIDVENYYSASCPEQVFRDIFNGYTQRLIRHRALDFDDMVVYTYELLTKRNDIKKSWQERFKYILIDEFQDINRLQYENIRMLAEPENNIFIVGDDDQSIYGFRGARPDIMLSFPEQYPEAKTVKLRINYRCSTPILKAAGMLINHNSKRYKKEIEAADNDKSHLFGKTRDDMDAKSQLPPSGCHIKYYTDLSSEAEGICEQISSYMVSGVEPGRMAVLFRTNNQMRMIAGKLMDRGIPFRMKEAIPNIFKSFIAKDLIAYLQMACGDDSRETFLQIMNRPLRYISRKALDKPEIDFRDIRDYYMRQKQHWMIERIQNFEKGIASLRKMTPLTAIHYIRKQIGYEDFLKDRAAERGVKPDDWFETLEEIEESATGMTSIREWLEYVENYEEELKKLRDENRDDELEGVELMTMHGAKGLEFMFVFIPTLNEGVCPYRKATLPAEIEEERRMLYVAMTRASYYLQLSYVGRRFNKKAELSRFIDEIEPKTHNRESS